MAKKVKLYFSYMTKSLISVLIGVLAFMIVLDAIAVIMGRLAWNPLFGILTFTIPAFFLKVLVDLVAYFLGRLFKASFLASYITLLVVFAIFGIIGLLLPSYSFEDSLPVLALSIAIKAIDCYGFKNRLPWAR